MDSKTADNILLIYYSRTGFTKKVAEELVAKWKCNVEVIEDVKSRGGIFGYMRSGYEALHQKLPDIMPIQKDPSQYKLVVIGTPVWAGNIPSPVRTYLTKYRNKFKRIAFFCTYGGSGADKVFNDMAQLCVNKPIATMAITDNEIKKEEYKEKIHEYTNAIGENL